MAGLGEGIRRFGRGTAAFLRFGGLGCLEGILGCSSCRAFRFCLCLCIKARHNAQVANGLVFLAEVEESLKKEERGRFWAQEEQDLVSIPDRQKCVELFTVRMCPETQADTDTDTDHYIR
jgi:hypothetical protein